MAVDPHWESVVLLLHMDGANGSTTFPDESPSQHSVTATGNAVISTAQSKFGTASFYVDGAAPNGLEVSEHADFGFGTGAWTVDLWAYFEDTDFSWLVDFRGAQNHPAMVYVSPPDDRLILRDASADYNYQAGAGVPLNQWTHLAMTYDGTTLRSFIDGVLEEETVVGLNFFSTRQCRIGKTWDNAVGFDGYLDEVRITKGVARWTTSFTPPTEPAEIPSIVIDSAALILSGVIDPDPVEVVLLMHMEGPVDSQVFLDSSAGFNTLVPAGAVKLIAGGKFGATGMHTVKQGNPEAGLSIADSVNFGFGTGSWTVELWLRNPDPSISHLSDGFLFDFRGIDGEDGLIYLDEYVPRYYNGTVYGSGAVEVPLTGWAHLAYSYNGIVLRCFVDGVLIWSETVSLDFGASNELRIGKNYLGLNGHTIQLDEVRITKGLARYYAAFTPPIAAFPDPLGVVNTGQLQLVESNVTTSGYSTLHL